MFILFVIWTIVSFIFLSNYVGSQKYYENSDIFNLWIEALCFPAFFIASTALAIGEYIEREINNGKM